MCRELNAVSKGLRGQRCPNKGLKNQQVSESAGEPKAKAAALSAAFGEFYFQCSESREVKWQHNAKIRLRFPKWDTACHPWLQTRDMKPGGDQCQSEISCDSPPARFTMTMNLIVTPLYSQSDRCSSQSGVVACSGILCTPHCSWSQHPFLRIRCRLRIPRLAQNPKATRDLRVCQMRG